MGLRVVVAEDSYLLREGVVRLVQSAADLQLVGICEDYVALLEAVHASAPDVVVTDIRMPPTGQDEGIRAAQELRTISPRTGVVVLTQYANPTYLMALLEGGSQGRAYLLKERVADADVLLGAVREVANGGSVIDPSVVEALVAETTSRRRSQLRRLSPREQEVVAEMASGKSNAAIATALSITDRAVEKHINAIFSKLSLGEESDV